MEKQLSLSNLIDVNTAAELLGLRPSTIRKRVLIREIPFYKIGARIAFCPRELLTWREQFHVRGSNP
jgi:excisionase family DNA binding protein